MHCCNNNTKVGNNEFQIVSIKNSTCDIIQIEGFDFDNILLDKKSYKNILIYDVTYKTLIGIKVKVDGFNRVYDGTRYLVFSIIWS